MTIYEFLRIVILLCGTGDPRCMSTYIECGEEKFHMLGGRYDASVRKCFIPRTPTDKELGFEPLKKK
jgi:hypothetical protein